MVVFPNAKINIGLYVTGKRADGFHDLATLFYPISIHDALEISVPSYEEGKDTFVMTGSSVQIEAGDNLCEKAAAKIRESFPSIPHFHLHLHKGLPAGGGIGGGSSDGAFTLKLLNEYFNLGISDKKLATISLELGSDCPFFIYNTSSFATGRGEIMEPVELNLNNYSICIVNPGLHISTAQAFKGVQVDENSAKNLIEDLKLPVREWQGRIRNVFEDSVIPAYPVIGEIKSALLESGALYASMSGTGSTVYGIFEQRSPLSEKLLRDEYFIKWL